MVVMPADILNHSPDPRQHSQPLSECTPVVLQVPSPWLADMPPAHRPATEIYVYTGWTGFWFFLRKGELCWKSGKKRFAISTENCWKQTLSKAPNSNSSRTIKQKDTFILWVLRNNELGIAVVLRKKLVCATLLCSYYCLLDNITVREHDLRFLHIILWRAWSDRYRHFGRTRCLHLWHRSFWYFSMRPNTVIHQETAILLCV